MNSMYPGYAAGLALAAVLSLVSTTSAQVIHTAHDHIPNFAASPTIRSAGNGAWSSPATWTPARLPTLQDVVSISHSVVYDSRSGEAEVIGIEAGGSLRFATNQDTSLRVGTLMVLPNGTLEIGTPAAPIAESIKAEIVIRDKALNAATDPDQYGTGLVSIDGTVTMHGALRSPTFVRTAVEPKSGDSSLSLEIPVSGWRVGDRIFVPDTRQVPPNDWFNASYPLQIEERIIQTISPDGKTLGLAVPLQFDHKGARDADGTPTLLENGIRLLPHVGNLTRNVVIRSENPSGTRGHTLYTRRSNVRIAYVQLQDLGRTRSAPLNAVTNHIGRYPVHMHHVWGPTNPTNSGYQFSLVGNAVNDSLKWPIAVHGSHYGLVRQNVVYGGSQLTGAGIAVEDGSETENLFESNFVANIRGNINPRDSGPGTADGTTAGSAAECYWAVGFNNRFIDNVAASCRNTAQQIVSGPGWKFVLPAAPGTAKNPKFRGADMTDANQTITVVPQHQAIREFRGNEVYGLAADGLTAWQLGTDGYDLVPATMPETVIKDFRVWHTYEGAIWNYPVNRMTIDGLVYRIDPAATVTWPAAVTSGDYRDINLTVRGGSIHAGSVISGLIDPLGTFVIENVSAITRDHAFTFSTPATPGSGARRPMSGVTMVLRNNPTQPWPGRPSQTIRMEHTARYSNSQPDGTYNVFVYDYQGQAGNDFRVYFREQATQFIYGGMSPCNNTTVRPEVDGITCAMSGTPPPQPIGGAPPGPAPVPPSNLRIIR